MVVQSGQQSWAPFFLGTAEHLLGPHQAAWSSRDCQDLHQGNLGRAAASMGICMTTDATSDMASGMTMATDGFVSSSIGPVAFHHRGALTLKALILKIMDPKRGYRPLKMSPFALSRGFMQQGPPLEKENG